MNFVLDHCRFEYLPPLKVLTWIGFAYHWSHRLFDVSCELGSCLILLGYRQVVSLG